MANASGKTVDKTHLSVDQATERGFLHRDYIAHCLRWSHVIKYLQSKKQYLSAKIFDIGCGKEVPLAKTLHSMRMAPKEGYYIGVDVNKLAMPDQFARTSWYPDIYGKIDFASDDVILEKDHIQIRNDTFEYPTVITCFEVLEHVEPEHAFRMMQKMAELAQHEDAVVFISTPNFDPHVGAAANHVNEMKHDVLHRLLLNAGLSPVFKYGTFASMKDYQDKLSTISPDLPATFYRLRKYYDTNVLACLFAPLFPREARNCLWVCRATQEKKRMSFRFDDIPGPWSSSDQWETIADLKGV